MADPSKSSSSDSEASTDIEDTMAQASARVQARKDAVEGKEQSVEISDLDAPMGDDHDQTHHDEPQQPPAAVARKMPPTASRRARIAGIRKQQPTTNKRGNSKNSSKNSTVTTAAPAPAPASAALATMATPSSSRKRRASLSNNEPSGSITTARGGGSAQKRSKPTKRVNSRVRITKSNLYHVLPHDEQKLVVSSQPNSRWYYGTITAGNAKFGYTVKFDLFPVGFQEVPAIQQQRLHAIQHGLEEPDFDREIQDASNPQEDEDDDSPFDVHQSKTQINSAADFVKQSTDDIKNSTSFSMSYGNDPMDVIEWIIHADDEFIDDEEHHQFFKRKLHPLKYDLGYTIEKDQSGEWDYNAIFFDYFFPSFKGHAKRMDEYLSSPKAKYHSTVEQDGIKFYQPDAPWHSHDPDQLIRVCYTLMLAAASEVHQGLDNLWRHGPSPGRHPYPDYGKYIPKNYMKAFLSAAPYLWCDEKYWYQQYSEEEWEIFLPMLADFNDKRKNLVSCVLLMLDESMSGWRPKTTKTGGAPNITYEPRKPVPLGHMLRNGCEALTGIIVHQDVQQLVEHQRAKRWFGQDSVMPVSVKNKGAKKKTIVPHVAECLRQCEECGLHEQEDGWVAGDAWFGSVMCSVELKHNLNVDSTFIIKQQTDFYPKQVLLSILRARYPTKAAGHWVSMDCVIAGVPILVIAWAYSAKQVAYFVTTVGSTQPAPKQYKAWFEDDFGNRMYKLLPRPDIVHKYYDCSPLIDEHNKQRQGTLELERVWLTKNCWSRLKTTLLGQSVVDMQRFIRARRCIERQEKNPGAAHDVESYDEDLRIKWIAERITKWLDSIPVMERALQREELKRLSDCGEIPVLERIQNEVGSYTNMPTDLQIDQGRKSGRAKQMQCFVCRLYLTKDGKTTYNQTAWWCRVCHMPLCKVIRKGEDGRRSQSCADMHLACIHGDKKVRDLLMCSGVPRAAGDKGWHMPSSLQEEWPRSSSRLRASR